MDPSSRYPAHDASELARPGAWQWLLDVRPRLGPVVEILSQRLEPLLPLAAGVTPARVRQLLLVREPPLDDLLRRALASARLEIAPLGDLRVAALRLETTSADRAALLVLAEPVSAGPEDERRTELARVAQWVVGAIRTDRVAASAAGGEPGWRELSALHRVLQQAVGSGSPREVVRVFVEALAIWSSIEAYGYVGDVSGRFVLDVALAGADPAAAPSLIDSDPVPAATSAVRLGAADTERLGFRGPGDLMLARVQGTRTAPWLIAHVGTADARDDQRLVAFSDVLVSAVEAAGEVEASRLMWALTQRLVGDASVHDRALAAASELADLVLASVTLVVRRADGGVTLQLGEGESPVTRDRPVQLLTFPMPVPRGFSAVLALRRPGASFTRREQRLGEVAASLLGSWISGLLQRGDLAGERRTRYVSFDDQIDRWGAGASGSGSDLTPSRPSDASLLIIRTDVTGAPVDLRQTWVGEIRRHLRPFDVAGTLTTGEIGVLLPDTPAQAAQAVLRRLRRSFQDDSALAPLESAPIGMVSRQTLTDRAASLVREARARAAGSLPE